MALTAKSIALADWRRKVAELYSAVRHHSDPREAWRAFRAGRDELFKSHSQSPLTAAQKEALIALPYFPYDPAWRAVGSIDDSVERETLCAELAADGQLRYTRVARVRFTVHGAPSALSLFWIEGYGGGLFLPFRDATNGYETYSGGRYLYDTIKGADLSRTAGDFILDFNYAYNPSCAYNDGWDCPLPLPENRLPFAVVAGERAFERGRGQ